VVPCRITPPSLNALIIIIISSSIIICIVATARNLPSRPLTKRLAVEVNLPYEIAG
jgi:hypothetical protein